MFLLTAPFIFAGLYAKIASRRIEKNFHKKGEPATDKSDITIEELLKDDKYWGNLFDEIVTGSAGATGI